MSTKVDTIDDFIQLAEEHGAEVQIREERETAEGFAYDTSGYTGGCGLPSCRCSPGLWVNVFGNGEFALVSFTPNLSRGDPVNDFTPEQHQRFLEFCKKLGIEVR